MHDILKEKIHCHHIQLQVLCFISFQVMLYGQATPTDLFMLIIGQIICQSSI